MVQSTLLYFSDPGGPPGENFGSNISRDIGNFTLNSEVPFDSDPKAPDFNKLACNEISSVVVSNLNVTNKKVRKYWKNLILEDPEN